MSKLFKYLLCAFAALSFAACEGHVDNPEPDDPEPEKPVDGKDNVPEGVLRIFADKTEISADGNEEVTFTVMFGSEDVSNAKTLQLVRTFDGKDKYMARGVNKFSTVTAGTYTFRAEYYYGGNHKTDNEVEIVAEQFFTGDEKNYRRRYFGTLFTSTGCTYCPVTSKGLKDLQAEMPGEISVAAFHSDFGGVADPMTITETAEFTSALGGFTGLPTFFWNMRPESVVNGGANKNILAESLAKEQEAYDTYSGVAVETMIDGESSLLTVNVGVTSNKPSVFRYLVLLVEDDIPAVGEYEQSGNGKMDDYIHYNAVRDVLTDARGDKLNDNLPLSVGVEARATVYAELAPEWKQENMRVIVAALSSEDGGYNWTVNNVNECKVGGDAPYLYEE